MTEESDELTLEDLENMSEEELTAAYDKLKSDDDTDGSSGFDYPKGVKKDTIFRFFRYVIDKKDSSKVANFDPRTELGMLELPVRNYLSIGNYCEQVEELPEVAKWFYSEAEVIAATSMGKKGFLSQLFVTQIKKEQKITTPKKSGGFLGFGKKPDEETN